MIERDRRWPKELAQPTSRRFLPHIRSPPNRTESTEEGEKIEKFEERCTPIPHIR